MVATNHPNDHLQFPHFPSGWISTLGQAYIRLLSRRSYQLPQTQDKKADFNTNMILILFTNHQAQAPTKREGYWRTWRDCSATLIYLMNCLPMLIAVTAIIAESSHGLGMANPLRRMKEETKRIALEDEDRLDDNTCEFT